jgi:CO/xanthine dehydrogenase Mo-binding subunit
VPQNLNTLLSLLDFGIDDEPLLSEKKVSYKGEPVAAVVAETERAAREAVAKVRVDWEQLPAVFDVEDAIKPGAPVVNEIYPTEPLCLSRQIQSPEAALRRCRGRLRQG